VTVGSGVAVAGATVTGVWVDAGAWVGTGGGAPNDAQAASSSASSPAATGRVDRASIWAINKYTGLVLLYASRTMPSAVGGRGTSTMIAQKYTIAQPYSKGLRLSAGQEF
jgi:hypothetical protein